MHSQHGVGYMLATSFLLLFGSVVALLSASQAYTRQAITSTAEDPDLQRGGPCQLFILDECASAVLHDDPAADNVDVFFKVSVVVE